MFWLKIIKKSSYLTKVGWINYLKKTLRRRAYLKYKHVKKHGAITNKEILQPLSEVANQISKLSNIKHVARKANIQVKTPKNFCLINNPCESLLFISKIRDLISDPNTKSIDFNHRHTTNFSLGAESLLATVVKTYSQIRVESKKKFQVKGTLPSNQDYADLLREIGIVKELDADISGKSTQNTQNIHLFTEECLTQDSSTISAEDKKTKTTEKFVAHINDVLKCYSLKLKDDARDHFRSSLAEVLDNAEEHCKLTAPKWFIRGYLNNNCEKKTLELVIYNFGNSISDNFNSLNKDSFTRKRVDPYVERHCHSISKEALYAVMALQLRVSTKNKTRKDTRGHGTIKLIKLFQSLHSEFQKKMVDGSTSKLEPQMSILSGHSYIKFDGTYSLKKRKVGNNLILPFNNSGDEMHSLPDPKYVKNMDKVFFPGVMINIRVPLLGSIEHD